jgi:hypothetical protein
LAAGRRWQRYADRGPWCQGRAASVIRVISNPYRFGLGPASILQLCEDEEALYLGRTQPLVARVCDPVLGEAF